MRVDKVVFESWLRAKFNDIIASGDEFQINDPWWRNEHGFKDEEHKCWINVNKACFHAFKSGKHGSLIAFIKEVEGCDWSTAYELVGGGRQFHYVEKQLRKEGKDNILPGPLPEIELPPYSKEIDSLNKEDPLKWAAVSYLRSRKISTKGLFICDQGRYKNRIIIPYYDKDHRLVYFNARSLNPKDKVRYLGPDKEQYKVGKSDVLWMSCWPPDEQKVYVTEGEFDAMTLAECGLFAAACGSKNVNKKQLELMKPYKIALAFDSDKAGDNVYTVAKMLLQHQKAFMNGIPRITLIRPPVQYKDWNNFLVHHSHEIVKAYIGKFEQPCTFDLINRFVK